jgi:hypothetical protein
VDRSQGYRSGRQWASNGDYGDLLKISMRVAPGRAMPVSDGQFDDWDMAAIFGDWRSLPDGYLADWIEGAKALFEEGGHRERPRMFIAHLSGRDARQEYTSAPHETRDAAAAELFALRRTANSCSTCRAAYNRDGTWWRTHSEVHYHDRHRMPSASWRRRAKASETVG